MNRKLEVSLKVGGAFAAAFALAVLSNTPRWNQILGTNIPEIRMPSWPKSVAKPAVIKEAELGSRFGAENQAEAEREIWSVSPPTWGDVDSNDCSGVYACFHRNGEIYVVITHDGQPDHTEAGRGADANWMISTKVSAPTHALTEARDYFKTTFFTDRDNLYIRDVVVLPVMFGSLKTTKHGDLNVVVVPSLGMAFTGLRGSQKVVSLSIGGVATGEYTRFDGQAYSLHDLAPAQPPVLQR